MTTPTASESDRFGVFGGRYVPETLIRALDEVVEAYSRASSDPKFQEEFRSLQKHFVGRPTPLYHARRLLQLSGEN